MRTQKKAGALVLAAALMAPTLAAAGVCPLVGAMSEPCCPPSRSEPVTLAAVQASSTQSCCEVSSRQPAPPETRSKDREAPRQPALAPSVAASVVHEPDASERSAALSPPRASSLPLQTLHCVFLI